MCQHTNRTTYNGNDFFCSSLFTQKRSSNSITHNQHKNKHSTNIASIDTDAMFSENGKNNIYISDTSCGYTEIDMINLFGSPAGRAINKITSIKLNKSEAAKVKVKNKIIGSSGSGSIVNNSSSSNDTIVSSGFGDSGSSASLRTNSVNRDHSLLVGDQQNSIKAISGSVDFDTFLDDNNSSSTATAAAAAATATLCANRSSSSLHRSCITKIKSDKCTNLHKKKVKCWEFLENDKLNNNWNSTPHDDELKVERFDELITDAEIYQEAVRFLGLSCSFTSSCRCLECQSRYFEFDEDEDNDDDDYDDDDDGFTDFFSCEKMLH